MSLVPGVLDQVLELENRRIVVRKQFCSWGIGMNNVGYEHLQIAISAEAAYVGLSAKTHISLAMAQRAYPPDAS